MRGRLIGCVVAVLALGWWGRPAEAARSYTIAQTPVAPVSFGMGTAGTLTYRITNTNNGGNVGERIYELRFRLPGTGTTFAATTAAPAGWTRTAYSTTSVTFRATSWANAIATGAFRDFAINFTFRSTTVDVNETLRDIRARYTTTTTGPPFTRLASVTTNNPGSWTLKSLSITSFQITDPFGAPVSAVAYGAQFRLVMTVRNNSTATQTAIISNANPPGRVPGSLTPTGPSSTVYTPNPLTLAAGASGTITFTYTAPFGPPGTIQFTASARNGANTATSSIALSNILTVSPLNASLAVTPSCLFTGDTATFTMTVTNNTGAAVTNVTPSALTRVLHDGAGIGAFSAPNPAWFDLAVAASNTFTWTATVTGVVPASGNKPSFEVTGTASANGGLVTPLATSPTQDIDAYLVSAAPSTTNASSTNGELIFTVNNRGCAAINSVSIAVPTIPSGWSFVNGPYDSYSEVDLSVGNTVDTWTMTWSDPSAGFAAAPTAAERLPIDFTGDFSMVFSAMPTATGTSNFTITITDVAVPVNIRTPQTSITVNPFDSAGPNAASGLIWQEQVR